MSRKPITRKRIPQHKWNVRGLRAMRHALYDARELPTLISTEPELAEAYAKSMALYESARWYDCYMRAFMHAVLIAILERVTNQTRGQAINATTAFDKGPDHADA
jgi:hypothetical protein